MSGTSSSSMVACPVCSKLVRDAFMNSHLDSHFVEDEGLPPEPNTSKTDSDKGSSPQKSPEGTVGQSRSKRRLSIDESQAGPSSAPQATNKRSKGSATLHSVKPLAERVRPGTIDEFVGQQHLLGPGTLLRTLIDRGTHGSLVLWGPPGTGKTTLARALARSTQSAFKEVSATGGGAGEVKKLLDEATNLLKLTGRKTLLFVDEIQRFNKAQQDIFLPYVESGTITVLLATTENPSFRLNSALLSRCRVVVLHKLSVADCATIVRRALDIEGQSHALSEGVIDWISRAADGDARVALSSVELALAAVEGQTQPLSDHEIRAALAKAHLQNGDNHYDSISALHKSVRGGDTDASLYWLARMLEAGEDPLYIARRIVRMASEDIGLANPSALPQALAAYQTTQIIGMPECDCILAQAVVMLAESPKSVRVYNGYNRAKQLVRTEPAYPVPMHIRNAPTGLMKSLGYGLDYRYNPGYVHPVYQPFLPPELEGRKFIYDEGQEPQRVIDEEALKQWEKAVNHGQKWEGRPQIGLP